MLAATFPKTIKFLLELSRAYRLANADRSQIHQVLLNLCVNARTPCLTTDDHTRDGVATGKSCAILLGG